MGKFNFLMQKQEEILSLDEKQEEPKTLNVKPEETPIS